MWLRTPPKPVDALITLLMSLSLQGFIAVLKIAYLIYGPFPHLDIKVIFAVLFSFLLFLGGLVKLLTIRIEQKHNYPKAMCWNYRLIFGLSFLFILDTLWILKLTKIL